MTKMKEFVKVCRAPVKCVTDLSQIDEEFPARDQSDDEAYER